MKNTLTVKKFLGEDGGWLEACHICSNDIGSGYHYIKYGPKYGIRNYHLTCFNVMEQKQLNKCDLCINNIHINLKLIEDFKKRVSLKEIEPMKIDDKNTIKIKISNKFYNQDMCEECKAKIEHGDIYIDQISAIKKFHFSCFQKYEKNRLSKWNTYKSIVQNNLNKLEPYTNEMICEGLEGIGGRKD